MLKKFASLFVAFAAVVLTLGLAASPATADVPDLKIGTIGYNAVGPDTVANRNAEFVDIVNTSTTAAVNVKDLLVQDAWSHGRDRDHGCNTYKVTALPGVTIPTEGADVGKLLLPAEHTIRVYVGSGVPKVFGPGSRWHAVYMDSLAECGFNGQFLNNNRPASGHGPWDTVWITVAGVTESKSYGFPFGFYVN